jgi:predicted CoA-binding protein
MDHSGYSESYIRGILNSVKTIAIVGASANEIRPSFLAQKYLQQKGYRVLPVNPGLTGQTLLGEPVFGSLSEIDMPIDMVDIFRNTEAAGQITDEALALTPMPQVIWMQLTIINEAAAAKAEAAGLKVVMNRCPKIEYGKLCGEWGWMGGNSGRISSKRGKLTGDRVQSLSIGGEEK